MNVQVDALPEQAVPVAAQDAADVMKVAAEVVVPAAVKVAAAVVVAGAAVATGAAQDADRRAAATAVAAQQAGRSADKRNSGGRGPAKSDRRDSRRGR